MKSAIWNLQSNEKILTDTFKNLYHNANTWAS